MSPGVSFAVWSYKFHTVLVGIECAQPVIGKDVNSGIHVMTCYINIFSHVINIIINMT